MYQRIKNKLDMEIIKDFLESEQTNQNVVRRMEELTDILDGAYGGSRGAFDMGGYILFFGDRLMKTISQRSWSSTILTGT